MSILTKRHTEDYFTNEKIYNIMVTARARLIRNNPFWGYCGLNLRLVELPENPDCQTLATDGFHIYYYPSFVEELKNKDGIEGVVFGVAHEIMHVISSHVGTRNRTGKRDPHLWNIATDFYINGVLVEQNIGRMITAIKIIHDEKYYGWASEEIYNDLLKDAKQYGGMKTLDFHIDGSGSGSDSGDDDGKSPGIGYKPTEEESKQNQEQWEKVIYNAAVAEHQKSQSAGTELPSFIKKIVGSLVEPKHNWKRILRGFVTRIMHRGYSFTRPNKSMFQSGFTIPGFRTEREKLSLAIALDTSGSVSMDQHTKILSEIRGILKAYDNYELDIWCFGSQVLEKTYQKINNDTGFNGLEGNIVKIIANMADGGGTVFETNWGFMRKHKIKPQLLLVATDGYPNSGWGDPTYCPTMFMVVGSRNKAPFGMTVFYEDS